MEQNDSGETIVIPEKPKTESLYWFGALPAPGPVKVRTWKKEAAVGKRFDTLVTADPWALWEGMAIPDETARIWVGKCRFFQSVDVHKMCFPAYSEIAERQAANEAEVTMTAYPGRIATLPRKTVEEGLRNCWQNVIRFPQGADSRMELQRGVEIIDLKLGHKPANISDADWSRQHIEKGFAAPEQFNEETDIPIAEFVYCVELDAPAKLIRAMKADPVTTMPQVIQLAPHGRMTEDFFKNPPQSVAEMYPNLKEGR
jgi:hypothetical protein